MSQRTIGGAWSLQDAEVMRGGNGRFRADDLPVGKFELNEYQKGRTGAAHANGREVRRVGKA